MLTQELIEYIRQAQEAGMTTEQIRKALAESGWAESDITQALTSMNAAYDTGRADRIAASITPATPFVATPIDPPLTAQPLSEKVAAPKIESAVVLPEELLMHKRHTGLIVSLLTLVLLLLGGGMYAYAEYSSLPRVVVAKAAEKAVRVTSYEADTAIELVLRETGATQSPQPMSASMAITALSQYDHRASTTPRMHANITLTGDLADVSMKGTAELARIGNEFFFRVREVPAALTAGMGETYTYLHDRWFSVNADTLTEDMRRLGASQSDVDSMKDSFAQALRTKDRFKELSSLFADHVEVLAETGEEVIDGEPSRTYTINGSKEFWVQSFKTVLNVTSEKDEAAFQEMVSSMEKTFTDTSITGTLWIGKDSKQIRKIDLSLSGIITEDSAALSARGIPETASFTLHTSEVFRKFNEPGEIVRPDPSTSFFEAIQYFIASVQNTPSVYGGDE